MARGGAWAARHRGWTVRTPRASRALLPFGWLVVLGVGSLRHLILARGAWKRVLSQSPLLVLLALSATNVHSAIPFKAVFSGSQTPTGNPTLAFRGSAGYAVSSTQPFFRFGNLICWSRNQRCSISLYCIQS
jgi:hypothetical protein